jgi:hypothetical protein
MSVESLGGRYEARTTLAAEHGAEAAQRARELEVDNQRAQDGALQAYIEGMDRLLIDKSLRGSAEGSDPRAVGRARTLTVLPRLYGSRKASVLQFLYEAGLIRPAIDETKETTVVKLDNADLRGATGITNEELERQAESLEGTVMPDGSKHP